MKKLETFYAVRFANQAISLPNFALFMTIMTDLRFVVDKRNHMSVLNRLGVHCYEWKIGHCGTLKLI